MFEFGNIVYHEGRAEKGIFTEYLDETRDTAYVYFDSEGGDILVTVSQLRKNAVD